MATMYPDCFARAYGAIKWCSQCPWKSTCWLEFTTPIVDPNPAYKLYDESFLTEVKP